MVANNEKKQTRLLVENVKIGTLRFEGLRSPKTAKLRISTNQVSKLLFSNELQNIVKYLKEALGQNFIPLKCLTEFKNEPVSTITFEQFQKVISYFAEKGNLKAIESYNKLNFEYPIKQEVKKTNHQKEKQFKNKLANKFNGEIGTICKTGIVDIITEEKIIEVKRINEWKQAVGKICIYNLEFPDKEKVIALLGETSNEMKQMITLFCKELNVNVIFEN